MLHRLRIALGRVGPVPKPLLPHVPVASRGGGASYGSQHPKRMAPVRLLVFSHNLNREGASISLMELVCGLKLGGAVVPEVVAFQDGPVRAEYESHGIVVHILGEILHKISTPDRLNLQVDRIASLIRDSAPDVVFVNTLLNFPAVLAADCVGVPSIWNPRESEPWEQCFRFLPDAVAQRAIAAIALPARVVFVAEATRAVWRDFDLFGNFTVIHNALNLRRFATDMQVDRLALRRSLGWGDDEIVFLNVGTLCERKGQMDAIGAIGSLPESLAGRIRLVFAGSADSVYARRLKRAATDVSSRNGVRIDFAKATPKIGEYYRAADAFMLCARMESYPRVILEAMAFGLPVIATPVFGVKEQLDSGEACFYEPGDITSLAAHMRACIADREYRWELGRKSRKKFEQLESYDEMTSRYREVIEGAVARSVD